MNLLIGQLFTWFILPANYRIIEDESNDHTLFEHRDCAVN